jgi:hypothetical protein
VNSGDEQIQSRAGAVLILLLDRLKSIWDRTVPGNKFPNIDTDRPRSLELADGRVRRHDCHITTPSCRCRPYFVRLPKRQSNLIGWLLLILIRHFYIFIGVSQNSTVSILSG